MSNKPATKTVRRQHTTCGGNECCDVCNGNCWYDEEVPVDPVPALHPAVTSAHLALFPSLRALALTGEAPSSYQRETIALIYHSVK